MQNVWTQYHDKLLKKHRATKTLKQLSLILGFHQTAISRKIKELNLDAKAKGTHWTREEEQFVIDNWATMSAEQIADCLPGKSKLAVNAKRFKLDIPYKPTSWTLEDAQFVKDNFESMDLQELSQKLNRPPSTIKTKCQRMLGIRPKPRAFVWTQEKINILTSNIETHSYAEIADLIGCSSETIQNKAQRLGLCRISAVRQKVRDKEEAISFSDGTPYSQEDDNFIKNNFYNLTIKQLSAYFPNRSYDSLYSRTKVLGLHKEFCLRDFLKRAWKDDETAYLVDNFKSKSLQEIANYLGFTKARVRTKAVSLKLIDQKPQKKIWTVELDQFICDNYPTLNCWEIGKQLDLTQKQVSARLAILRNASKDSGKLVPLALTGVTKQQGYTWTEEEDKYILDNIAILTRKEIAKHLGRNTKSIYLRLKALGKLDLLVEREEVRKNKLDFGLTDLNVLNTMSKNIEEKRLFAKHPELIKLKRTNLIANRLLKNINE